MKEKMNIFIIIVSITLAIIILVLCFKKSAENKLIKVAEQGDVEASFKLSQKYKSKKLDKARKYLEQAAKNGHVQAQFILGEQYSYGCGLHGEYGYYRYGEHSYGIEKNFDKAFYWFEKSATQGSADAQYYLGFCYLLGSGTNKDVNYAFPFFKKAAEQGHTEAQYELGCCYLRGDGVQENIDIAINWFQKAAKNGSCYAGVIGGITNIDKYLPKRVDVTKRIGLELVKKGYKLDCSSMSHFEGVHYLRVCVYQGDKKVGEMEFGGDGKRTFDLWWSKGNCYGINHIRKASYEYKHMIYLEKARILIESETHYSEPPPEWLVICGRQLLGFTIDYPDWVKQNPDAAKYVNTVFNE